MPYSAGLFYSFRQFIARSVFLTAAVVACAFSGARAGDRKLQLDSRPGDLVEIQNFQEPQSIYWSLGYGASIYQGMVVDHHALSDPNSAIEYGIVTVQVSKTYWGNPKGQVVIPYSILTPGRRGFHYFPIWPSSAISKPKEEICVVLVPHSFDRAAGVLPGIESAASYVFVADRGPEKSFDFVESICSLEKNATIENQSKRFQELQDSTTNTDERVRRYAVDALANEFMNEFSERSMDALRLQVTRAKEIGTNVTEARHDISLMRTLATDTRLSTKAKAAAARSLALLILETSDITLRATEVENFAAVISSKSFETPDVTVVRGQSFQVPPIKASELISTKDVSQLRIAINELEQIQQETAAAKIVNDWLDAK